MASAKFYFFDTGVANSLVGRGPPAPGTREYGAAFEHLIALELRAWIDYKRAGLPLTCRRTPGGERSIL